MTDHDCKYESDIREMNTKLDTMMKKLDVLTEAQVGSPNGSRRGNLIRLEILEAWKLNVNKVLWVLFVSCVGSLVLPAIKNIITGD